ncbi:sortase, SrtB family [Subdoligranulum variabile DSM 15176]|uniref:Sortase, SrtB family n=2 Tax=Subdoligranulum variabile TaxID=214851 RepID=D1PLW9_9FIRM|nr:sortase, SrtB family [Subdoligranulum variabile DSM 15176]
MLAISVPKAYSKNDFDEVKTSMAKIRRDDDPYKTRHLPPIQVPEPTPEPPRPEEHTPQAEPPRRRKQSGSAGGGKHSRSNVIYNVLMFICLAVFLVSGGILAKRYYDDRQTENEFANLQSMIDTDAAATGEESNSAKFAALRDQNGDFIGWISIEGTNLDFPVMFAPDNKDFYLRHDFNKEYSVYGVPYLDEKTTLGANDQSENLIVYGHNMKTGTIFGCLTGYKKADYYTEHPRIQFDTVYGDGTYEVFAAFAIDVVNDTSFAYNQYVDLDEAQYNEYVEEVISRSDVDTGIRPSYGEQLLTLSTCEYSSDNGRYVVVARRVDDK